MKDINVSGFTFWHGEQDHAKHFSTHLILVPNYIIFCMILAIGWQLRSIPRFFSVEPFNSMLSASPQVGTPASNVAALFPIESLQSAGQRRPPLRAVMPA